MGRVREGQRLVCERQLRISMRPFFIAGTLFLPPGACRFVLFARGKTGGSWSPEDRYVAAALNEVGMGAIVLNLLTPDEGDLVQGSGQHRFAVELLAGRLAVATDWVTRELGAGPGSVGYFASSVATAAALMAAAARASIVGAVVSRRGRPDLGASALEAVHAPTLLIVGDDPTAGPGPSAGDLPAPHDLRVLPGGASFGQPGALETVTGLAATWFHKHLATVDIGAQPERPII